MNLLGERQIPSIHCQWFNNEIERTISTSIWDIHDMDFFLITWEVLKRRKASEVYRPAVWVINKKYGPFQNGISWVIPACQKQWIHDASFEEIQKVIIADKGKENKYVTMFWIHLMIKKLCNFNNIFSIWCNKRRFWHWTIFHVNQISATIIMNFEHSCKTYKYFIAFKLMAHIA